MNTLRCQREDELLEALGRGFVPSELDEHVRDCGGCGELKTVAGAVLSDRAEAAKEARIPSAQAMWWRIQVRQQQEMQTAARRSLLVGQAATLAFAIALVAVFFGADVALSIRDVVASIRVSTPVALLLGWWLLAAPVAGWVALRQK